MKRKTILITGGAGFIGSALIRYIIGFTPDRVVNLDKLTYAGNLESVKDVCNDPKYIFEHADICDHGRVSEILKKHEPEIIIHLAAETHVDSSIVDSSDFINTNILGTYTLLEAARKYWNQLKHLGSESFRFHHVSTDEVFGDLSRPHSYFTTKTPYAPSNPYSATKAASDHLVRAWQRTYKLPVVVTNCSNNYGPYQFPEKLIPLTIINALQGKHLPVYGDGAQVRDWLFVEDHVKALYLVATKAREGKTYNIGGCNEVKNIQVVKMICSIMDESITEKPMNIDSFEDLIEFVDDRPGHDSRYATDNRCIERDLGWTPNVKFEEGLRKTINWYLDNEVWYSKLQNMSYRVSLK